MDRGFLVDCLNSCSTLNMSAHCLWLPFLLFVVCYFWSVVPLYMVSCFSLAFFKSLSFSRLAMKGLGIGLVISLLGFACHFHPIRKVLKISSCIFPSPFSSLLMACLLHISCRTWCCCMDFWGSVHFSFSLHSVLHIGYFLLLYLQVQILLSSWVYYLVPLVNFSFVIILYNSRICGKIYVT